MKYTKKEQQTMHTVFNLCIHSYLAEYFGIEVEGLGGNKVVKYELKMHFKRLKNAASHIVDILSKRFTFAQADFQNEIASDVGDITIMVSMMTNEHRHMIKEYTKKLFEQYKEQS